MKNDLINSNFLKKLERLKLNSNMILNKGYSGSRKSKSKGSSVEFSDFREYVAGDDFRKIDWNAYARFDKLFIKLFMEEREALINIFLDSSKSMDFGEPKKSFLGQQIALSIGYLSLANMDRLNIYNQKENGLNDLGYINGKNTFNRLVDYVGNVAFDKKNDMFEYIPKVPYKRGISIIISDLFTERFEETVKYLSYMNQSIIVIHILNQEEIKPSKLGDMRFVDSETGEGKDVSVNQNILKAYDDTFNKFIENIREVCRKYGCSYTLAESW